MSSSKTYQIDVDLGGRQTGFVRLPFNQQWRDGPERDEGSRLVPKEI